MNRCTRCNRVADTPYSKRIEDHGDEVPICEDCYKNGWPIVCPCGLTFIPLDEDQAMCPDCGRFLERVVG